MKDLMSWKFSWVPALFPLVLATAACDACTGALGACGPAELRYEGELARIYPEAPASNVRVEFAQTGGVALADATVSAVTDPMGRFLIESRAAAEGEVIGNFTFYPPGVLTPVQVTGVTLTATRSLGGRVYAGKWTIPYPHLPYEATFYNPTTNRPVEGIEIEFRRTGGIAVEPDTFTVTTNSFGTVKLRPLTEEVGQLIGELLVKPLPPYRPYLIEGLRMKTFTEARFDSTIVRASVGPYLPYAGVLVWEDGGVAAANVQLELRRTGGILYSPAAYVTETDAFGTFWINPTPLGFGNLEADLVVVSPQQLRGTVVRHFNLSTVTLGGPPQFMGYFTIPGSAPTVAK